MNLRAALASIFAIFLVFSTSPAFADNPFARIAAERAAVPSPKDILSSEIKAKIRQKLERKLSATLGIVPIRIAVDGDSLEPASTIDQLILRIQEMLVRIEYSANEIVDVHIDGEKFRIHRKPLGEGLTSVVYRVDHSPWVIKFPSPDVVGLNALIDEGFILPHVESLKAAGLLVAPPVGIHPAGIFAVKIAAPPVNLTQNLLQSGLVTIVGGAAERVSTEKMRQILRGNNLMRDLASLVMKMVVTRRQFPNLNLDLGPDNLHITQDSRGHRELILVDTGRSGATTKSALDSVRTFDQYLSFAATMMNRYLSTGVMKTPPAVMKSSRVIIVQRTCESLFATAL